jgi:hypothetical protein
MTLQTHQHGVAFTSLERAVFEAVAYADVFDFPVTLEEVLQALPATARRADLAEVMAPAGSLAGLVGAAGRFYVLAGRESLIEVRRRRAEASGGLMRRGVRYGSLIARLPFVRLVAITGSLAVENAEAVDDVDYLIVTAKGRLWLTRALTMLVVRLAGLRGLTLCPNYLLSESALALRERDLYTARELLQMRLVGGQEVYARMLAENAWTRELLPNWDVAIETEKEPRSLPARLGERLLGGRLGDALERSLQRRKGGELRAQAGDKDEAEFNEDVCKGHFDAHRARLRDALAERMRRLEGGS